MESLFGLKILKADWLSFGRDDELSSSPAAGMNRQPFALEGIV